MQRAFAGLLAAWLAGMVSAAMAAPIPVSSSLDLSAYGSIDPDPGVSDSDFHSQGATTGPLNASVHVQTIVGGATIDSGGDIDATWTNPGLGQVVFSNLGWSTTSVSLGAVGFSGDGFHYVFTTTGDGTLTVDYGASTSGTSTFGLGSSGFVMFLFGSGLLGTTGQVGTGSVSAPLVGSTTYDLWIFQAGGGLSGSLGTRSSFQSGTFDFEITQAVVPEPSGMALLGAGGLGLVGFGRRRKRTC